MIPTATERLSRERWKLRVRVCREVCKGECVGTVSVIREWANDWKSWLGLLSISSGCNQLKSNRVFVWDEGLEELVWIFEYLEWK